jgi:hypothetical protein
VHVRINGRLGRVVGLTGSDGAGEAVYEVKMTDDNSTLLAGESSLGDSSELTPAGAEGEESVSSEPEENPATEAPAEPAPEAAPVADEPEAAPAAPEEATSSEPEAAPAEVTAAE